MQLLTFQLKPWKETSQVEKLSHTVLAEDGVGLAPINEEHLIKMKLSQMLKNTKRKSSMVNLEVPTTVE